MRLIEADLVTLGVEMTRYQETNYERTQQIGAAVAFLECDGLIAPSARWACENLMLFTDNQHGDDPLEVIGSSSVEWLQWAREHSFLDLDPIVRSLQ
jgi:hypothetical protein